MFAIAGTSVNSSSMVLACRQMVHAFLGQGQAGVGMNRTSMLAAVQRRRAAGVHVSPVDTDKCRCGSSRLSALRHAGAQPGRAFMGLRTGSLQRRYVLKNLVRDWGEEGAPEREQSYGRILAELQARYPVGGLTVLYSGSNGRSEISAFPGVSV